MGPPAAGHGTQVNHADAPAATYAHLFVRAGDTSYRIDLLLMVATVDLAAGQARAAAKQPDVLPLWLLACTAAPVTYIMY